MILVRVPRDLDSYGDRPLRGDPERWRSFLERELHAEWGSDAVRVCLADVESIEVQASSADVENVVLDTLHWAWARWAAFTPIEGES